MIKNFKSKKLSDLYFKDINKGINPNHLRKVVSLLFLLEQAETIEDLQQPSLNFHKLSGNLKNYWSVRISGNWRIIFKFENGYAVNVDYLDYH